MNHITATAPLSADVYKKIHDEIHQSAAEALDRMDDRTRVICRSRNRLLGKSLADMRTPYHRGPLKRLLDAIGDAWALLYGMVVVYSEMLGLIEEVYDE